jgi:NitT/TauT family transport system substrate-binding protein
MPMLRTRRRFLATLALAGAAGILRAPGVLAAEGPLETTRVRRVNDRSICIAPEYVADELLRADIRYVEAPGSLQYDAFLRGELDFIGASIPIIEAGAPIVVLAGINIGCFELFATEGVRHIADLKGKTIGLRATPVDLLRLTAAEVGLDPANDIRWVAATDGGVDPLELFVQGKIDAFLGFPPEPQELRARRVGHVILNTTTDRPWSQYFCCMLASSRDYVRKYPVATKRVLRAVLKAADLCAAEPDRVARRTVSGGFAENYDYALQTVSEIPYEKWREYDPEDTMRFFALRLHEAGLIKSSPQKGKSVGVPALGSNQHIFLTAMVAHIGLDPVSDIHWVTNPSIKPVDAFVQGKSDGFLGFPPEPQELRARNVRHVVVNSALDRPWSECFCGMLAGNSEYIRKYPVATKRVLRALLKAADLYATAPAVVAWRLVDGGFTDRYGDALQMLKVLPYDKWRQYGAEDTVRFYALRLHDAGMIKADPKKIIADTTDGRFLNDLKRELRVSNEVYEELDLASIKASVS